MVEVAISRLRMLYFAEYTLNSIHAVEGSCFTIYNYNVLFHHISLLNTLSTPSLDDPPMREVLDPVGSARIHRLSVPARIHHLSVPGLSRHQQYPACSLATLSA